jgi:hypothetical protein
MKSTLARMLFLASGCQGCDYAAQLILNGGFETGTLTNWTVSTEVGSFPGSSFYAQSSTTTPQTGLTTVGPESGTSYAVSDGAGSAATVLSQTFTVPQGAGSVVLSYGLFVNSGAGGTPTPAAVNTSNGLDFNQIPSQFGIVSLLSGSTNLFSTGATDLRNFYEGVDAGNNPNAYTNYSFNVTSLVSAGGAFTVRFGAVDNVDALNVGVDNVSVVFTAASIPEPASILLGLAGTLAFALSLVCRRTGHLDLK